MYGQDYLQGPRPAVPGSKGDGFSAPWNFGGPQRVTSNGATPLSSLYGANTPSSVYSMNSMQGSTPHALQNGMTPLSIMGSNIPTPMSMYFPPGSTGLTPTLSVAGYGGLTPSAAGFMTPGASGMAFTPTQFLAAQAMGGAQMQGMFFLSGGGNAGGGHGVWCVTPHAQMAHGVAQSLAGDAMLPPATNQAASFAATPHAGNGMHPMGSNGYTALSGSTPVASFGAPPTCFAGPLMPGMMTPHGASMLSPGWLGQGTPMVTAGGMGILLGAQTPNISQAQPTKAAFASATSGSAHAANSESVACAPQAVAAYQGGGGAVEGSSADLADRSKILKVARQDDKEKPAADSEDVKRPKPPSQPSSGSALQAGGILGPLLAGKLPVLENTTNAGGRGVPTLPGFSPSIFLSTLSPTVYCNSPALLGVQQPISAGALVQQPISAGSQSAVSVAKPADGVHVSAVALPGGEDGKGSGKEANPAHRPAGADQQTEPASLLHVTSVEGGGLRARRAAKAVATTTSAEGIDATSQAQAVDSRGEGGREQRKRRLDSAVVDTDRPHKGDNSGVGKHKKRPPSLAIGLGGVLPS